MRPITPPRLTSYSFGLDQTGSADRVSLQIEHDRGEATIDIRPVQPLAGEMRPELAVRAELVVLQAAIAHILEMPGAISRLGPDPIGQ